ncbi:MAG TPA: peptidyl-prolyl cis-trans isomerase [Polyangiaceae bacterium]
MQSKRTAPYVFALLSSAATMALADQATPVITVGSASMTAADVSRRLAALPAYQVSRYGTTPEEIKKRFVEEVLVPEMLYGEEALRKKTHESPALRDKLRESLRDAVDRNLREEALQKQPVTAEDIKKYYDENKSRFETPKRIRVWRIQVADEASAKEILAKAKGSDGVKNWSEAAREKSLDKATSQRSGDLGFVRADGSTDVPRVQVDPAIFAAADKVADGALVGQPVKEGDKFSVVWRRGSVEATKRTVEDETPSIRQVLERRRIDSARQELIANLKKDQVKEFHPELLSNLDASMFGPPKRESPHEFGKDGGMRRMRRDGGVRPPKPARDKDKEPAEPQGPEEPER